MASIEASIPRIQVPQHLPFNHLLQTVSEGLTGEDFKRIKRSFTDEIWYNRVEHITDPWDLLRFLKVHNYITEDNVILLQRLMYNIKNNSRLRSKLLHSIITYARQRQTFYVEDSSQQTQAGEGFDFIHLHININLPLLLRQADTSQLVNDVTRIFGVDPLKVSIVGSLHSNSYVVTLKIPTDCAEMIPYLIELGLQGHFTAEVDKIAIGSHVYDVKEKKEVVENIDKHREDFIRVYANAEIKTNEVKELHQPEKKWENESKVLKAE